jgi:hypothetical protein
MTTTLAHEHYVVQQKMAFRSRVVNEVARANQKHGEGRDLPNGTGGDDLRLMRDQLQVLTDRAMKEGKCTWRHIFLEEVFEAVAEVDSEPLLEELTQVSAVIDNWVEAIIRKRAGI